VRFLPARSLGHDVVAEGLGGVEIPGRLEVFRLEGVEVPVVLDVAHNPDGVSALVSSLADAFAFDTVRFVVGIMGDKDHSGMLGELARLPCSVVLTQSRSVRSLALEELETGARAHQLPYEVRENVEAATDRAIETSETRDLVCVTGSHYVVGEARAHLISRQRAGEV
jgi:dihydrofolate synthase / folylpolyglutamate synthase